SRIKPSFRELTFFKRRNRDDDGLFQLIEFHLFNKHVLVRLRGGLRRESRGHPWPDGTATPFPTP
ncbi:MAG: hypothetical protein WDZ72_02040, partial [Cyclobacteriaceae bacterium]